MKFEQLKKLIEIEYKTRNISNNILLHDLTNVSKYLESVNAHKELASKYRPTAYLTEEDRLKMAASRVGLNLPKGFAQAIGEDSKNFLKLFVLLLLFSSVTIVNGADADDLHPDENVQAIEESPTNLVQQIRSILQASVPTTLSKDKIKLAKLVKDLENSNDPEAQMILVESMLFGSVLPVDRNIQKAFQVTSSVAQNNGNSRAHFLLGFFYSVGLNGIVERDQAKALLHYTFASMGNDVLAWIALGNRYANGIGVDSKCEKAIGYYKSAADYGNNAQNMFLAVLIVAARDFRDGVRSGNRPTPLKTSLSEEEGGLYGVGASSPVSSDQGDSISVDDLIQYHQHNADRGDANSQVILGQLYYFGRHALERNYEKALYYFKKASSILPPTPPQRNSGALHLDGQMRAAAQAVLFLGNLHWNGHGVPQDNATAARYFKQAAEFGNTDAMNNLGVMYKNGIVVKKDLNKAFKYFKKAADAKNSDAMVNLSEIHKSLLTPDYEASINLLTEAVKRGNVAALYFSGKLYYGASSISGNCHAALLYYKTFVEKADYERPHLEQGYQSFQKEDYETAFLRYLLASELGYDVAHMNVAWMLEHEKFKWSSDKNQTMEHALIYYQRAANLGNSEARVKVGDLFYDGRGAIENKKLAVSNYMMAADSGNSAIAWFNLGYVHQEGIGVEKDYHLAKRYYDRALEANSGAYLPVALAKSYLNILHFMYWLKHGGSFYLDSPPSKANLKSSKSYEDLDESLLSEIKKAQEERIKKQEYSDETVTDEIDEMLPLESDSDLWFMLVLIVAAGALFWVRQPFPQAQQPPIQPAPPVPVQPPQEPLQQRRENDNDLRDLPQQRRQGNENEDAEEIRRRRLARFQTDE